MLKNWEVSPSIQWKLSARAAIWGAVANAFGAGVLTGLVWAGRLPFDSLRLASLAVLLAISVLLVLRFAVPRIQR